MQVVRKSLITRSQLTTKWRLADESPQAADTPVQFTLPGPSRIPFGAPEVCSIVDNLFAEGRLKPIPVRDATAFEIRWEQVGVEAVSAVGSAESVQQLAQQLAGQLPEPGVPPTIWTAFALRWAELSRQLDSLDPSEHDATAGSYQKLQAEIDSRLQNWLFERYAALASRSFIPTGAPHRKACARQRVLSLDPAWCSGHHARGRSDRGYAVHFGRSARALWLPPRRPHGCSSGAARFHGSATSAQPYVEAAACSARRDGVSGGELELRVRRGDVGPKTGTTP